MDEISIPHAKAFVDKSETPFDRLLVWTWLPEHRSTNEEHRAHQDMMNAIAAADFHHSLHGRRYITWSNPMVRDTIDGTEKYRRRGVFQ